MKNNRQSLYMNLTQYEHGMMLQAFHQQADGTQVA